LSVAGKELNLPGQSMFDIQLCMFITPIGIQVTFVVRSLQVNNTDNTYRLHYNAVMPF